MKGTNLQKLKILVDELEFLDTSDSDYTTILSQIEGIIQQERKIISNLERSEKKISHYENICSTILSLISKTKLKNI